MDGVVELLLCPAAQSQAGPSSLVLSPLLVRFKYKCPGVYQPLRRLLWDRVPSHHRAQPLRAHGPGALEVF